MSSLTVQSSDSTPVAHGADVSISLRCHILDSAEGVEVLAPEWDRLWRSNPNSHIFQRFTFISSWLTAYRRTWRPYMPVVTAGDRVIGIIPLVISKRQLRFAGHLGSDYNDFLCAPPDRAIVFRAAIEALFANSRRWDRMVLENIPGDVAIESCIASCPQYIRRRSLVIAKTECPTLVFGERNESLREAVRKDKLRKAARVFERLGTVTYRHLDSGPEIREHLPQFIEQHTRRHRLAGRKSVLGQPEVVQFIEALADSLDTRRELRFSVLEVNGRPAAYHFGYLSAGRYVFHKPTFDVDLWDYSPGQVLLFHLWNSLLEGDATEFDFSVGPETYKYRFANHVRHNIDIAIYSPGVRGSLCCGLQKILQGAAGTLRRNERLVKLVKQSLSIFEKLRAQFHSRGPGSLCLDWLRKYVYRRQSASIYVQKFAGRCQSPEILIRAKLSTIIDQAGNGSGLDDARLQITRERLKSKEDPAYLLMLPGRPSEVAWTRRTDKITLGNRSVALSSPALVVYDHWNTAAPSYEPLSPELLDCLSTEAGRLNLPLCIVGHERRACESLRKAGFIPLATVTTRHLFGSPVPRAHSQAPLLLNVDSN